MNESGQFENKYYYMNFIEVLDMKGVESFETCISNLQPFAWKRNADVKIGLSS
jgi:hypothetical protein